MTYTRRAVLAGAAGLAGTAALRGSAAVLPADAVHVSAFGAKGDGVTNDTDALHEAAQAIQRRGGGTLVFEAKTYVIGKQLFDGSPLGWAYQPSPVIDIRGCPRKVTLIGNGARLRSSPGLRFGTFDPRTGRATKNKMPFTDQRQLASPYRAAIWLQDNRGGLEVSGFELDGRINQAIVGGPWGDTGWQINHCGLWIYNNTGAHLIKDVYSHHHGQDGMVLFTEIRSENSPAVPMRVENFRGEYNGRQGISLTGGRGVTFVNCQLNHTGKNGVVASNPGGGIDIEAEMSLIRDVTLIDCEFDNNYGQGMVADTGNSAGITLQRCKFIGTTNYAAWPNKPRIRFYDCEFVGAITRCFEDPEGTELATQFVRCRFSDDPARSPTRTVYGERVDLGGSGQGTLFQDCQFTYTRKMQLPYTPHNVRYHNCTMSQASTTTSYPTGIYTGTTRITAPEGAVELGAHSRIRGRFIRNGVEKAV
jgi:parallel beta helix pectate lyase-like protein